MERVIGEIEAEVTELNRNTKTPSFPIPNPTFLPDRLVATFIPILTIRHPCRMISSLKRAIQSMGADFPDEECAVDAHFKWQRMMFDFYKAWFSTTEGIEAAGEGTKAVGGASTAEHLPIVIDGDKLINDPEAQMDKLCRILNLDSSKIHYTWEARESETPGAAIFVGTLNRSSGIIKGKDGSDKVPVLDEEVKNWTEEWGERTAEEMKFLVERTMDDYDHLLERSI
ncbi:hypothetical protein L218DRAFT_1019082 [Marasmius fiardii PR-910]|nr:hypothetical protein L218DRAFT_1019082 [Marasmius fiardii PR-910]